MQIQVIPDVGAVEETDSKETNAFLCDIWYKIYKSLLFFHWESFDEHRRQSI